MAETAERTTVAEFLNLVEDEWFKQVMGDLMIEDVRSSPLAACALAMRAQARENWDATHDAMEQYDGAGVQIAELTEREIARRVVEGLAILFYGGASVGPAERQRGETADEVQVAYDEAVVAIALAVKAAAGLTGRNPHHVLDAIRGEVTLPKRKEGT